jgi:Skp family chaperone for outer membrane proteins
MWAIRLDSERRALLEHQRKLQAEAPAPDPARTQLELAFQRSQVEFTRLEEDARNDMVGLERQVAAEFQAMLAPILDALVKERGLTLLFDREASVILWTAPVTDVSDEVVKRLDAAK